jgi:hypothetical protein
LTVNSNGKYKFIDKAVFSVSALKNGFARWQVPLWEYFKLCKITDNTRSCRTKYFCTLVIAGFMVITLKFLPKALPSSTRQVEQEMPTFTDITKKAGLDYRITCGDEINEYLIDINGQGACFIDYDNDGYQDLYLANGSSRRMEATGRLPRDYLLRNIGDGTFTDVTEKAHLGDTSWGSGCAVGDYNNDGYLDLYVTNYGPNKLYRNNGNGTFTEVGENTGVAGPRWDPPNWSMGAAFGDYDGEKASARAN